MSDWKSKLVEDLRDRIDVGRNVATELLTLAGWDVDLAEEASRNARGLDQCKANIIDERIHRLEMKGE